MTRYILLFFIAAVFSCKNDDPVPASDESFEGEYFYAAKKNESGNYGAMDIIITVSDKNNVRIEDDFADPADLGPGKLSGNTLTAKQHVDAGYDTRDITLAMTRTGNVTKFVYDVDFTEASGDYHIEGILTKQ